MYLAHSCVVDLSAALDFVALSFRLLSWEGIDRERHSRLVLCTFVILELGVGGYFPSVGSVKSYVVPEHGRRIVQKGITGDPQRDRRCIAAERFVNRIRAYGAFPCIRVSHDLLLLIRKGVESSR